MCNLSEGIAEEARAEAWSEATKLSEGIAEEAREEGREQGFDAGNINCLMGYIKKKKISVETALDDLDVPTAKRDLYTMKLREMWDERVVANAKR